MSVSTHYIRTIHTSFTAAGNSASASASSSWACSSSSHSNLLAGLGGLMSSSTHNGGGNRYPPGLGLGEWRSNPSGSTNGSTSYTRKRSNAVRAPYNTRRPAPPPPSRAQPASLTHQQQQHQPRFDPFSDDQPLPVSPVIYNTQPSSGHRSRLPSVQRTIYIPSSTEVVYASKPIVDRDARSKLVAGILLNRVHAAKPVRRRFGSEPKAYVPSRLSTVVSVEA